MENIKKQKLLIVGDFKRDSGVTKFILGAFRNLADTYSLVAVNISGDNGLDQELKNIGWRVVHLFPANQDLIKHLREWHAFIHQEDLKHAIVYFNYSASWNVLPVIEARIMGGAVIVMHAHNTSFGTEAHGLKLWALTVAHHIGRELVSPLITKRFAASIQAARWLFPPRMIRGKQVEILNNGVDVSHLQFSVAERNLIRDRSNADNNTFVVGNVGVLEARKNQSRLIHIFQSIKKVHPNSQLWILGEGSLLQSLKDLAKELGIEKSVVFWGSQSEMGLYYSGMDAFVMTSRIEGLSIAYLEAQAEGLPTFMASGLPLGNPVKRLVATIDLSMSDEQLANQILTGSKQTRYSGVKELISNGYGSEQLSKRMNLQIAELFESEMSKREG